jgi:L-serine/L-threonine ammonia-lyase
MTPLHIPTPLISHAPLSASQGRDVLLKMDSLQPSGSFKLRGLGLMCQRAVAGGATQLVCPSGGNAGFATAVAGVTLGVRTTIVVPETTAPSVRERIASIGATVVVHGRVWDEANLEALRYCSEPGAVYVPPFDHADIWDGNATLIDEAAAQVDEPFDAVICSVGGGGLLCGVVQGLHRNGLHHVPVIAVETEGAASFTMAVRAGRLVTLPAITSIATTLGAKTVAQAALDWTTKHEVACVTVTDKQAVAACLAFADDMRTLVEPACGASLAVVYENHPAVSRFKRPLVVVCGGIGVDLGKLAGWKHQFGL